jgi:hypothetical protein
MIKLANSSFIPVAGDDWYQRRREDAEGTFWRTVANQGPRKGAGKKPGGSTRQGIYVFTAAGKLLGYKNAQDAATMLVTVKDALRKWNALPEQDRKPGAVQVPALGKVDATYARSVPEGGLVLKVYTRVLDKDKDGAWARGASRRQGGDQAARDHVWLKKDEWPALVPARPREGDTFAMPAALAARLLRFHLVDNTRGEPNFWARDDVRKSSLTWKVAKVSDAALTLELTGSALLATRVDATKAERGFDVTLRGTLVYDRKEKRITRFDLLAVGDHWGEGTYTRGARPGRTPLGVWMELTPAKEGADRVPPQAAREQAGYFAAR